MKKQTIKKIATVLTFVVFAVILGAGFLRNLENGNVLPWLGYILGTMALTVIFMKVIDHAQKSKK